MQPAAEQVFFFFFSVLGSAGRWVLWGGVGGLEWGVCVCV